MTFVMDMIKGIFIGVANIIPGVSGGTMAVSLGIYDKLIGAVSNLLSNWKKSLLTLLPSWASPTPSSTCSANTPL